LLAMSFTISRSTPQSATVTPLLSKDLAGISGKELSMITVECAPGESDPVHTHHEQALVYVLEGSIGSWSSWSSTSALRLFLSRRSARCFDQRS